MGNIRIYKGMPPLNAEQLAEIEALKNMKEDEIDLSDIPEITDEEWKTKFKPARLRLKSKEKVAS